jgi:hypothetical protein
MLMAAADILLFVLIAGAELSAAAILFFFVGKNVLSWLTTPAAFAISTASTCSFCLVVESLLQVVSLGSHIEPLVPLGWMLAGVSGLAIIAKIRPPLWVLVMPPGFMTILLLTLHNIDIAGVLHLDG